MNYKFSHKCFFFSHLFCTIIAFLTSNSNVFARTTKLVDHSTEIGIVNAFSSCITHVINFPGYNLNYSILNAPILLLRYFSYPYGRIIFPSEFPSYYEMHKLQKQRRYKKANAMFKNLPTYKDGLQFVRQYFTESFQLSSKNLNCEANIYLHPPTQRSNPHLYDKSSFWESVIKHPFWVGIIEDFDIHKWKKDYLNNIPRYSILVCDYKTDLICHQTKSRNKWISSVISYSIFVRLPEIVLIWDTNSAKLQLLCPFCNPCNSFATISLSPQNINPFTKTFRTIIDKANKLLPSPHSVLIVPQGDASGYRNPNWHKETAQKSVLEHISTFRLNEDEDNALLFIADIHLISLQFPKTTNATYSFSYGPYYNQWKNIIDEACSSTKRINSHPKFRPMVTRHANIHASFFHDVGLIFVKEQLLFVSCHKEQKPWTHQLLELLNAFDVQTWSLILLGCFGVSYIIQSISPVNGKVNEQNLFWEVFVPMFMIMLDQSCSVLQRLNIRKRFALYCSTFFVPFVWLFLSTVYKGENITNLTADPPLKPFDTFESLKQNGFQTYLRRFNLNDSKHAPFVNIKESIKLADEYGYVKGHEQFPVVSHLWFGIISQLRRDTRSERSFNYLKDEISNQTWEYINNSVMLPNHGQPFEENVQTILDLHMDKCNKSAMILQGDGALQLYSILKAKNKPAYFGKDVISELLEGYTYEGYFTENIILNGKYLFQAGILKWWREYLEFALVLKTNTQVNAAALSEESKTNTVENENGNAAIAVLVLIPGVGLLISLVAFLVFDNKFWSLLGKKISKMCVRETWVRILEIEKNK